MDVKIRGTNMSVDSHIETFAHSKLDKLTRILPNIAYLQVDFTEQNNSRGRDMIACQITLRHSRGAILRAEERVGMGEGNAAKTALMGAIDKMYSRIERFKGKRSNSKRMRGRYRATLEELEMSEDFENEDLDELNLAPDAEQQDMQIIRRKNVAVTAMLEEEAIEQMELLGHTFFMFFNVDSNQINVVYKRSNGGYGMLMPQIE